MSPTEIETPAHNPGETHANVVPLPERKRSSTSVTDFVRDHPVLVVGGGLALGALAAALLPKGNRRRVSRLAEAAAAAGLAYSRAAWDRAGEAGHDLRERGGDLAGRAGERASRLGEAAASAGHRAIDTVTDRVTRIGSRLGR